MRNYSKTNAKKSQAKTTARLLLRTVTGLTEDSKSQNIDTLGYHLTVLRPPCQVDEQYGQMLMPLASAFRHPVSQSGSGAFRYRTGSGINILFFPEPD